MTEPAVKRVGPGESGLEAGLRETPYPSPRRGRPRADRPAKKETPEERDARLKAIADKFEQQKAKARLYARRHYRKKAGIPEKVPTRPQKPPRKRPALEDAIAALEAEREEITIAIETLRRYV